MNFPLLIVSFVFILVGAEVFTNGVEWTGQRLHISEAAVGSLLAAVGTALPETLIPAIALLRGEDPTGAHGAVGVGAIIGAPLMLSTIALLVMGISAIVFRKRRGQIALSVRPPDVRRDLLFFLPVFALLIILGAIPLSAIVRQIMTFGLLAIYVFYGFLMLRLKRLETADPGSGLYLSRLFRGDPKQPHFIAIIIQNIAGLALIIGGANQFIDQIVGFAQQTQISPGVLSLIVSPLATELPEKYNSIIWIRQRKDHLAVANITGAMVFQSCLPVAIGTAFTSWRLSPAELLAGTIAIVSATMLFGNVRDGKIGTPTLLAGGVGYALFLGGLRYLGVL